MSVGAVKFRSSMGCSPLRKDNNVNFAGQHKEEPAAENKKSNTGKYVAAGVGVAAAITAAVVFRKPIGNFIKTLKMPSIPSVNGVKERVVNAAQNVGSRIKGLNVGELFNNAKTKVVDFAKFVWTNVLKGANYVKDFAVSLWQKAAAFFTKQTPSA